MSGSTFPRLGRAWISIPLLAAALFILLYGWSADSNVSGAAALSPMGSGTQPVEGPPATLHIVDLRNLPPSSPTGTQDKTLPFRYPRGAAAQAKAQASESSNVA